MHMVILSDSDGIVRFSQYSLCQRTALWQYEQVPRKYFLAKFSHFLFYYSLDNSIDTSFPKNYYKNRGFTD